MFAAEVRKIFRAGIRCGQNNFSFDNFTKMRMHAAKNTRLADGGMTVQHGLDFFGENFSPSEVDDGGFARN